MWLVVYVWMEEDSSLLFNVKLHSLLEAKLWVQCSTSPSAHSTQVLLISWMIACT